MSEKIKANLWNIVAPIAVAVMFYAYNQNVKASIREELTRYVTQGEFKSYQDNDEKVMTLRLLRLEEKLDMLLKAKGLNP